MEYALITILTVGSLVFVAYPMFSSKKYLLYLEDMLDYGDVRKMDYLNSRRQLVFENLKELDFEYEMGKLSDEDYSRQRQGYIAEAQEVIQAVDKLKIKAEIEDLIEAEVRSRRRIQ